MSLCWCALHSAARISLRETSRERSDVQGKVSRVYSGKKKVGQYTGIRGYFDINVGAAAYTGRGCYCHRYCPLPAGSLGNTMCERNAVADYEIENPTWEVVHGLKNNPPYRDLPVAAAEEESDRYPCSQWASFEASVEGDVVLQKVGDELVVSQAAVVDWPTFPHRHWLFC